MSDARTDAIRAGTAQSFDQRQSRYIRLRDRVADGMTREQAGALETPPLSKARVAAILAKEPAPPGRKPGDVPGQDARENLRARLRYWQRKRGQTTGAVKLREVDDQIAGLTAELAAITPVIHD